MAVIGGRPGVFISCSEKFRASVADRFKKALARRGLHGVIVSEEPRGDGRAWEPENKVESYLRSCEAFIALMTPDDELANGKFQCRPNVADEIGRARSDPKLSGRMIIMKSPDVQRWSNINPTYEALDVGTPRGAIHAAILQLQAWGVIPPPSGQLSSNSSVPGSSVALDADLATLVAGLGLGDQEEAERRVYALFRGMSIERQRGIVGRIIDAIMSEQIGMDLPFSLYSVLEAIDRLQHGVISVETLERLANSSDFSTRSSAAAILWQWAEIDPGSVPVALLGQLAEPSLEDWYVQAPAMAAAKQLLLRRRAADAIFERLSVSAEVEDRYAVAVSLLEVAQVEPRAVDRAIAERLRQDSAPQVSSKASEVLSAIAGTDDTDRVRLYGSFGL